MGKERWEVVESGCGLGVLVAEAVLGAFAYLLVLARHVCASLVFL